MVVVPDTRCACGFIFRKFYGRRYFKIVDAVCWNPEAETGIKRICNLLSIIVININIFIWFAAALVMLNLDDFPGLACTDGEITILPHVLPYSFCQRRSSRYRVVFQLGQQFKLNVQFLYIGKSAAVVGRHQIICSRF